MRRRAALLLHALARRVDPTAPIAFDGATIRVHGHPLAKITVDDRRPL